MNGLEFVEMLGLVAGAQTTLAFLPQVFKVWRSGSARDISLSTFLVMGSGNLCWLIYGVLKSSLAISVTNAATLLLVGSIVFLKIRSDRRHPGGG